MKCTHSQRIPEIKCLGLGGRTWDVVLVDLGEVGHVERHSRQLLPHGLGEVEAERAARPDRDPQKHAYGEGERENVQTTIWMLSDATEVNRVANTS